MLYHYNDTIVSDINIGIIYNGKSSVQLNSNLDISYAEIKKLCHRLGRGEIIIILKLMYLIGVKLMNTNIIMY